MAEENKPSVTLQWDPSGPQPKADVPNEGGDALKQLTDGEQAVQYAQSRGMKNISSVGPDYPQPPEVTPGAEIYGDNSGGSKAAEIFPIDPNKMVADKERPGQQTRLGDTKGYKDQLSQVHVGWFDGGIYYRNNYATLRDDHGRIVLEPTSTKYDPKVLEGEKQLIDTALQAADPNGRAKIFLETPVTLPDLNQFNKDAGLASTNALIAPSKKLGPHGP